jgi:hypothetical protein
MNDKIKYSDEYLLTAFGLTKLNEDAKKYVINKVFKKLFSFEEKIFFCTEDQIYNYKTYLGLHDQLKEINTTEHFIKHCKLNNDNIYQDNILIDYFNPFDLCFSKEEQKNTVTNTMRNHINQMIPYLDIDIIHNIFIKDDLFFNTGRREKMILNTNECLDLIKEQVKSYYTDKKIDCNDISNIEIADLCKEIKKYDACLAQNEINAITEEERKAINSKKPANKSTITEPLSKPARLPEIKNAWTTNKDEECIVCNNKEDAINKIKKILKSEDKDTVDKKKFKVKHKTYTVKKEQAEDDGCLGLHIRKFRKKIEYNLYENNELVQNIGCSRIFLPGFRNNKIGVGF